MPWLDHFGLLAPLYDRLFRVPDTVRLAQLVCLPIRGRLLDAGGGTGRVARTLVGSAGQVVVADESLKMLSHARVKPGLHVTAAHAELLPFPSGAFERVIIVDAYHHLQDQDRSLAELVRVCAPGGRVVIEEPDIEHVLVWGIALFERVALMRSRFRRAKEIAASFRALGAAVSIHRQDATVWIVAEPRSRG
ncbi:MAG: class I SAM-dependent methyltransferase [Chloroflexi bacterium]|jgi:demethylmenaquinone methyltransferase/2-methoxy-6-polyprenyl-1,4-benzoquinol methylase|nr:class I SAM-dependent methyltransferase [Chloroflexota bacterium]